MISYFLKNHYYTKARLKIVVLNAMIFHCFFHYIYPLPVLYLMREVLLLTSDKQNTHYFYLFYMLSIHYKIRVI